MNKLHPVPVARALISVSDKSGIVPFARALHALGIEILSTGGTARLLLENQVPVVEVADYTGFPEIMGGRVKTLHPFPANENLSTDTPAAASPSANATTSGRSLLPVTPWPIATTTSAPG